jgi:hypothetical protein
VLRSIGLYPLILPHPWACLHLLGTPGAVDIGASALVTLDLDGAGPPPLVDVWTCVGAGDGAVGALLRVRLNQTVSLAGRGRVRLHR